MTKKEAEKIVMSNRTHDEACARKALGAWDRSGNCGRCSAFAALNDAVAK